MDQGSPFRQPNGTLEVDAVVQGCVLSPFQILVVARNHSILRKSFGNEVDQIAKQEFATVVFDSHRARGKLLEVLAQAD